MTPKEKEEDQNVVIDTYFSDNKINIPETESVSSSWSDPETGCFETFFRKGSVFESYGRLRGQVFLCP